MLMLMLTYSGCLPAAEIEALKPLCAHTAALGMQAQQRLQQQQQVGPDGPQQAKQQQPDLQRMQALLVELLLLPNSRPLHKQLLSGLRPLLEQQLQPAAAGMQEQGFAWMAAARIAELAEAQLAASGALRSGGSSAAAQQVEPALLLGSALASLLGSPACKAALLGCAVPAVAALSGAIKAALQPAAEAEGQAAAAAGGATGGLQEEAGEAAVHVTTTVMEGLQDSSECRCRCRCCCCCSFNAALPCSPPAAVASLAG